MVCTLFESSPSTDITFGKPFVLRNPIFWGQTCIPDFRIEFKRLIQFQQDDIIVEGTLHYPIVVQDWISMQGEEIAISNKRAGSNKIMQAVYFVKKLLK